MTWSSVTSIEDKDHIYQRYSQDLSIRWMSLLLRSVLAFSEREEGDVAAETRKRTSENCVAFCRRNKWLLDYDKCLFEEEKPAQQLKSFIYERKQQLEQLQAIRSSMSNTAHPLYLGKRSRFHVEGWAFR